MMPIAPLMIEHRLIEKMAGLLKQEQERLAAGSLIDLEFNKIAVDFFRTYADRIHHGKEEQILFRELKTKNMTKEHRAMMEQLVDEHIQARAKVKALEETRSKQEAGEILGQLADLYPKHIAREDKLFFIQVMKYFNAQEQEAMLDEGNEFDQNFDKDKYQKFVEKLSSREFGGESSSSQKILPADNE